MVDTVEVYYLYEEGFGVDAQVEVYEAASNLEGFEITQTPGSPADVREKLAAGNDSLVSCKYESLHLTFGLDPEPREFFGLPAASMHFESMEFEEDPYTPAEVSEHVEDALELVARVYGASLDAGHRPVYVAGGDPTHVDHVRRQSGFLRTTREGVLAGEMEELYWLQILPPATVETVGREKLESAPAYRVEELPDGAVLLVAYGNPLQRGDYLDLLEYFSLEWE